MMDRNPAFIIYQQPGPPQYLHPVTTGLLPQAQLTGGIRVPQQQVLAKPLVHPQPPPPQPPPQQDLQFSHNSNSSSRSSGGSDKSRPFQCPKCPTSFTQKGNMTRHVDNVHNRTHRFNCTLCGNAWTKNSDLKRHLQTVHNVTAPSPPPKKAKKGGTRNRRNSGGERSAQWNYWHDPCATYTPPKECIKCDQCPVTFTRRANLERHVENVHEGIHKFACGQCGRRWAKNVDLQKHQAKGCQGPVTTAANGGRQ